MIRLSKRKKRPASKYQVARKAKIEGLRALVGQGGRVTSAEACRQLSCGITRQMILDHEGRIREAIGDLPAGFLEKVLKNVSNIERFYWKRLRHAKGEVVASVALYISCLLSPEVRGGGKWVSKYDCMRAFSEGFPLMPAFNLVLSEIAPALEDSLKRAYGFKCAFCEGGTAVRLFASEQERRRLEREMWACLECEEEMQGLFDGPQPADIYAVLREYPYKAGLPAGAHYAMLRRAIKWLKKASLLPTWHPEEWKEEPYCKLVKVANVARQNSTDLVLNGSGAMLMLYDSHGEAGFEAVRVGRGNAGAYIRAMRQMCKQTEAAFDAYLKEALKAGAPEGGDMAGRLGKARGVLSLLEEKMPLVADCLKNALYYRDPKIRAVQKQVKQAGVEICREEWKRQGNMPIPAMAAAAAFWGMSSSPVRTKRRELLRRSIEIFGASSAECQRALSFFRNGDSWLEE